MASMYRWSRIGTRLLYKIRHHKGHGIHSPFVFNLINNVIEEKLPYYSYKYLAHYLSIFTDENLILRKENLLAFRLVNYFGAKNILEIGSAKGINTLCLIAPSKKIKCTCIEEKAEKAFFAKKLCETYGRDVSFLENIKSVTNEKVDCIYINLNNYQSISEADLSKLVTICHEKSFIMVKGIRASKKQNKLWQYLTKHEARTAELDLFDIGLLFFDKQLYRWKYQISF